MATKSTAKSTSAKAKSKKETEEVVVAVAPVVAPIEKGDRVVENKLKALYKLQLIDTQVDKIRIIRGELPMEVRDLEDEVAGLETRIQNFSEEIEELNTQISNKKNFIKDAESQIKKYEGQQMNVKNNREFDSLSKEMEFQGLEIELSKKRIKESMVEIDAKKKIIETAEAALEERRKDLELKKAELDSIVSETQKEEAHLVEESEVAAKQIDERLLTAYHRVRRSARNGLGVVAVQRDACGGCFNKIPPQIQLDIRQHKKVIVCEHCGRILVDAILGSQ